jgi:hypothetical protein
MSDNITAEEVREAVKEMLSHDTPFVRLSDKMMITGIALAEGKWKTVFYPYEELKKSASKLKGVNIIAEHKLLDEYGPRKLGEVTDVWTDDKLKALLFAAKITDEVALQDIDRKRFTGVSVFSKFDKIFSEEHGDYIGKDIWYPDLSLVEKPACTPCMIAHTEYLSNSYNKLKEEEEIMAEESTPAEGPHTIDQLLENLSTEDVISLFDTLLRSRNHKKAYNYAPRLNDQIMIDKLTSINTALQEIREALSKPVEAPAEEENTEGDETSEEVNSCECSEENSECGCATEEQEAQPIIGGEIEEMSTTTVTVNPADKTSKTTEEPATETVTTVSTETSEGENATETETVIVPPVELPEIPAKLEPQQVEVVVRIETPEPKAPVIPAVEEEATEEVAETEASDEGDETSGSEQVIEESGDGSTTQSEDESDEAEIPDDAKPSDFIVYMHKRDYNEPEE